jgi:DNA-binding XRE family transcriptional regulator
MNAGQDLRTLREHAELSQDQVGLVLGVSAETLRRLENREAVDELTVERYRDAVGLLRSLRRQVSRRVARAAREAAAV